MSEEILFPPPSLLLSPMSLLHRLSAFRVLVCKAPTCKHALRPGGIADHLLGKHKISSKMRKPFLDYTATLDIVGPEDVQNPENGSFWIQELRLHKGHVCHICGYITTSKAYIEIHVNKKHGWIKKQGVQWDLKPVQTFFINNKTRYFIVT